MSKAEKIWRSANKYSEVSCAWCGNLFKRETKEINRSVKLGRRNYCCRSHQVSHRNKLHPNINTKHLRRGGKPTEFSKFLKFVRSIKRRSLETDITAEYLKEVWDAQKGICPFTGKEMEIRDWHKTEYGDATPFQASIDRIDNSIGYFVGNVRFICVMANLARSTWSDMNVIEFCLQVSINQLERNKELS